MALERYGRNNPTNDTGFPTIHIVSDSLGTTAHAMARAAAGQFGNPEPYVEIYPRVRSYEEAVAFLSEHQQHHIDTGKPADLVVFFTFVDPDIRKRVSLFCKERGMHPVDLMSAPLDALATTSGEEPSRDPGNLRKTDARYFRRIEAMEFTVEHDDGRRAEELTEADIVLLGVSRSSKTPISIYLGMEGYKVANVPLALGTEPPKEIFDCEPSRVFGLMTTPDVLVDIRQRRLSGSGKQAVAVASSYADPEMVYRDLEEARSIMKKVGCIVINTKNKAVEETAQEILRYYDRTHPRHLRDFS